MIRWDLHTHTHHSHARDSVQAMYDRAVAEGLEIIAFTEHSPRPEGYDYPREYRDQLQRGLPLYVREVQALQHKQGSPTQALLGMEIDWIGAEKEFVRQAVTAWPFEVLLGSVHFLDHWGFDADPEDWNVLNESSRAAHYVAYFEALRAMATSGLFHIAAHPDIIKLFSVDSFHAWLVGDRLDLVHDALTAIRDNSMSMEISSAGLRKPCAEIYPGPPIMALAADLGVPICFASDAHATDQLCWQFSTLAAYAASFGYRTCRIPLGNGNWRDVRFD